MSRNRNDNKETSPMIIGGGGNYHEIVRKSCWYLQSYSKIVARRTIAGKITLDPMWDCSVTTAKHTGQFLHKSAKDIRKDIAAGFIIIAEL